ncbi:hypothetical protein PHET_11116 [Paragonimus heterotremus]|uniref:Uncharacterized protein n=1 Tax=Paragonimus heterotremus TaxID=100268 RepID=A0A8J4SEZ9_9TREM|nr:hypothetical protein PHET_11116 [Paragonimus heterotremus]
MPQATQPNNDSVYATEPDQMSQPVIRSHQAQ